MNINRTNIDKSINSNTINSNTDILNIVITGVGGQGILTLAEILARATLSEGLKVHVGEIHGMAQRGGHVICTVRIGSDVFGPIIDPGTAHLLIGFEPLETLREIHLIKTDGYVIMNQHPIYPIAVSMGKSVYPSMESIRTTIHEFTPNLIEFNAFDLAEKAGSSRSMNMVMFGAIISINLIPIHKNTAISLIKETFSKEFKNINLRAFELGFSILK